MWFSTHRHHVGRSPLCRIHCSWNHQSLHRQPPLLPASLSALYCHITSMYIFLDFASCSTCCNGRYGGMPSGEKRQVAFRENYMQLKESSVYTPDCSSWWSEQKTKRGEPSCCSPAALLILSAPSISLTRLGFGVTRSLNRNSTSGRIFSELKRLFLQSMFLTCTFSICGDQRFKPPWY